MTGCTWPGTACPRRRRSSGFRAGCSTGWRRSRSRTRCSRSSAARRAGRSSGGVRRYRVHEHNSEVHYDAGFIAIGRLIPLGGGRWLRSPGMLIFSSPGNVTARDLAEGFEKIPALAPALIAEGIIAGVAGRGRVPRDVPPADSPAEAKDLLHAVGEALDAHGLRRVLPKDEAPPELRAADGEREFYVYEVDDDLAAWIEALGKLARRAPSRGGRAGRRAKARKKKGRGKRR